MDNFLIQVTGQDKVLNLISQLRDQGKTDLRVRRLALNITRSCPDRDYFCNIKKIHRWIIENIKPVRDAFGVEQLQEAWATVEMEAGDCDDFSILEASLLETIGIQTAFVVIGIGSKSAYSHIYLLAEEPLSKNWIPLDAQQGYPVGYEYLNPTIRKVFV